MKNNGPIFDETKTVNRKKALSFALIWVVTCALLSLCTRLIVFFAGPIASAFEPTLGRVLSAWKNAEVTIPVHLLILFGLVMALLITLLSHAARGKKRSVRVLTAAGGAAAGLVLFIGFVFLLLRGAKINGVPVTVIARIIAELSGSL